MIYKATLDKTAKLLTIGMPVILIGFVIGPKLLATQINIMAIIVVSIIMGLTYILTYGYSPTSYEIINSSSKCN